MIIEYAPVKSENVVFKPGHIYKLKDKSIMGIFIGHAGIHGDVLVSLVDGKPWNCYSTFGSSGPEAFLDVTHEFKVTNIK